MSSLRKTISAEPDVPPVSSGAPVIFYSDLTSAPFGAFVTIWGKRFGASQGASVVEVGGVACSALSWADDKIAFIAPSAVASGISVTSSSGVSNSIPFLTRTTGSIRFCAIDGNDANPGTLAAPWRNPNVKWNSLQSGDVMYIRAGAYTTQTDTYSGGTWLFWRTLSTGGQHSGGTSADLPIAMVGYPGEVADCGSDSFGLTMIPYGNIANVTFANMKWRSGSAIFSQNTSQNSNIRIVNIETAGPQNDTFNAFGIVGCSGLKVLGCRIINAGLPGEKLSHSIYYEGYGSSTDIEIAYNYILNQRGGRGIQVYGHQATDSLTNCYIHDNYVDTTCLSGILVGAGDGGTPSNWVTNAYVYNNVVRRSGNPNGYASNGFLPEQAGAHFATQGCKFYVYNNTFVNDNVYNSVWFDRCGAAVGGSMDFKNNLLDLKPWVVDNVNAAAMVASHNGLARGSYPRAYNSGAIATPAWWTNAVASAVEPAYAGGTSTTVQAGDYFLNSGSPFKGAGTAVIVPSNPLFPSGQSGIDIGVVSY